MLFRILHIGILTIISQTSLYAQQLLLEKYESIINESKKHNEEIAALYYKEIPVALIISLNRSSLDYAKYYMFQNSVCISETIFYPTSEYSKRLQYYRGLYGDPIVANSINNWIENGLQITLTVAYSKTHGKEICQINYAYVSSQEKLKDIMGKMQTPYIKMVTIKTNLK